MNNQVNNLGHGNPIARQALRNQLRVHISRLCISRSGRLLTQAHCPTINDELIASTPYTVTDPNTGAVTEYYRCRIVDITTHYRGPNLEAYLHLQFLDANGNPIGNITRRTPSQVYKQVIETTPKIPIEGEKLYHAASNRYASALVRYGNDILVNWSDNTPGRVRYNDVRIVNEIVYDPALNDPLTNNTRQILRNQRTL